MTFINHPIIFGTQRVSVVKCSLLMFRENALEKAESFSTFLNWQIETGKLQCWQQIAGLES